MSHLHKTRETYGQIAADYARKWHKHGTVNSELEKFIGLLPSGAVVLDVGCGPGQDSAVLQSHKLNVFGMDFSHEMMRVGRDEFGNNVPYAQADMRHLPVGQVLDGIWASASMLHLDREDLLPTLKQFWRILKHGGILYLSVKQGEGEKWLQTTKYGHDLPRYFTFWQPEALDSLLETAVFQIIDGWVEKGKKDDWLVRFAQKPILEAGR